MRTVIFESLILEFVTRLYGDESRGVKPGVDVEVERADSERSKVNKKIP